MHYFAEYSLFLAKTITLVVGILIALIGIIALSSRGKIRAKEKIEIKKLNDKYDEMKNALNAIVLSKEEYKQSIKNEKKAEKKAEKTQRKRIFVVHFCGDLRASAVKQLREEITAILLVATVSDEIVVNVESPGGMVHAYGLAASQLVRIRQKQIPLTVIVDKVAASGGYLMACVANRIIAAPFALVGSIGVLAQLPNFHRLLKKHDVEFEQFTAGEYKRTVTLFGENTRKGREKFQEEIEEVHQLFKQFILEYRPQIDIEKVATGEHWCATQGISLNLVDELMTSDDYLLRASQYADIYRISYVLKKSFADKVSMTAQASLDKLLQVWRRQDQETRLPV